MTTPSKELFRRADELHGRVVDARVVEMRSLELIEIDDLGNRIGVADARALRDWLNKVLPESAHEPGALRPGLERAEEIISAIETPADQYEPYKNRLLDALRDAIYSSETKEATRPAFCKAPEAGALPEPETCEFPNCDCSASGEEVR